MIRKFCCIFSVVCIFVSSFAFVSSAAGSIFESDLAPLTSYNDVLGKRHDFFAFYGSSRGVLFEFIYSYPSVVCDVSIYADNFLYSFENLASTVAFDVFIAVRDLKSGYLIYDDFVSVAALTTVEFSYNSPPTVDLNKVNVPSYSTFTNFVFFDCFLSVTHYSTQLLLGTVNFNGVSTQYGVLLTNLAEPVADNYNRFFVLANEEDGLLFHLSIWSANDSFDPSDVTFLLALTSDLLSISKT